MGYFNRDSNNRSGRDNRGGGRGFSSNGRSSSGRGGGFGGRDDSPREMFKTVCSSCGKECEVPFKPTSGKPVYCSDCFETMGGRSADSARPERNDRPRPSFDRHQTSAPRVDNSKQIEDLNKKLDKIIELLTPKAVEAPVAEVVESVKEKVSKVKKASKK